MASLADGRAVEDDLLARFVSGELGSDVPLSSFSLVLPSSVALRIQSNVFLRV